jgi:glycosyltransferase involved in cell wall biosynthesis
MPRPLNIFVPHCSDVLTDHLPHGDGLIAHGFITSLARRGHRIHVAAQRVELRQPIDSNITIYPLALKRSRGMRSRLEYMFRVRSLLQTLKKSQRFDLIHQLNPVFTGISLAMAGSGLPLVLGSYVARWPNDPDALTADSGRVMTRIRDLIAAVQQRQADALVLTTPAAWNRLPDLEAVRSRIHVIPHGLDTDLFSPKTEWDSVQNMESEQRRPSILFFANVVKRKGIFPLIEALPAVLREFTDCTLRVAGDGPDLDQVKRRVVELGCASQVEFLGHKERADAPELYRDCSVYCLPSYGEPYGMTVVEAMSCARSLVVTDCGALPHLVHEPGGVRVPAGDPEALAQALVVLLRDPAKRAEMGRYNRRLVENKMSWDKVAQQLEAIYEIVLSEHAAPSSRDRVRPAFGSAQSRAGS